MAMSDTKMLDTLRLMQGFEDVPNEIVTLLLDYHLQLKDAHKRMTKAAELISGWTTACDYRAEPYLQKAHKLLTEKE